MPNLWMQLPAYQKNQVQTNIDSVHDGKKHVQFVPMYSICQINLEFHIASVHDERKSAKVESEFPGLAKACLSSS